jgi:RNA polymerase sigma-70 factor (ECF subfamily)
MNPPLDERPRLFALAYRMLGSAADADDILQEAFLRWHQADTTPDSPAAWLTTVVTRLCLDRLKSAQRRRETYVGPWLPEPLPTPDAERAPDAAERVSVAESVSFAFLLVLERLSPLERAVFLLREVFDVDFAEIATALERSEAACRQLFHRAREHVAAARPRFTPARPAHQALVVAFLTATATGDLDAMKRLLTDDVTMVPDSGGKVSAARKIVSGADRVAKFLAGATRQVSGHSFELRWLNGEVALIDRSRAGVVHTVLVFSLAPDESRIARVSSIRNPDKLRGL